MLSPIKTVIFFISIIFTMTSKQAMGAQQSHQNSKRQQFCEENLTQSQTHLMVDLVSLAQNKILSFKCGSLYKDYRFIKVLRNFYRQTANNEDWRVKAILLRSEINACKNGQELEKLFSEIESIIEKNKVIKEKTNTTYFEPPTHEHEPFVLIEKDEPIVLVEEKKVVNPENIQKASFAEILTRNPKGGDPLYGVRLNSAQTVINNTPFILRELITYLRPRSKTLAQWAGEVYGVQELKPLTKTFSIELQVPTELTSKTTMLEMNLKKLATEFDLNIPKSTSVESLAENLQNQPISLFTHRGQRWIISFDEHDPKYLSAEIEVMGGMKRVFEHPTDPKKLVKVFDPSFFIGAGSEMQIQKLITTLIQWNLGIVDFFDELKKIKPESTLTYAAIDRDPKKLERAIFEVPKIDFNEYEPLGNTFELKTDDPNEPVPKEIENFFSIFNQVELKIEKLGMQRFGDTFYIGHEHDPTNIKEKRLFHRFKLRLGIMNGKFATIQGIDLGDPVTLDNFLQSTKTKQIIGID